MLAQGGSTEEAQASIEVLRNAKKSIERQNPDRAGRTVGSRMCLDKGISPIRVHRVSVKGVASCSGV